MGFPSLNPHTPSDRASHSVAADLDGTLLVSRSSFPYFLLLSVEAGSLLRGLLLLLLAPAILFLYRVVSEPAAIQLMIFISVAGLQMGDIELAARGVLPRFYAADVRADSWRLFRGCGRRRVVVTANPRVMVESFVREQLGGDTVLGTELEVDGRGRATGFVKGRGVLVGVRKREAVVEEFGEESLPELGLGDRDSDHDFMALCQEAYMVPPDRHAARVPPEQLENPIVFHDGRFVQRPEPLTAVLTFLWLPFGFFLALFRVFFNLLFPAHLVHHTYRLCGITLSIRGRPPPPPSPGSPGSLLICNHRTALDPIIISIALGRPVSCVTYSASALSHRMSPIPTVSLTRERVLDAGRIVALLRDGDVVVCPEGTTCREPYLLRFSPLFAELSDRIVPVAVTTRQSMFYATTVRGWKFMDPYFFYMNPRPAYEVTFLDPLPSGGEGRSAVEVANEVQKVLGEALGFECTTLARRDKYLKLGGSDGKVKEVKDHEPSKDE